METASHNPLTVGLSKTLLPEPCTLVIFGGAGDLSRRKLLPGVYNLMRDGVLPANFAVVGFARTDLDDAAFRNLAREGIEKYSRRTLDPETFDHFAKNLFFVRGAFNDPASYAALRQRLDEIEPGCGVPGNRIYYLSIPPSVMGTCVENLQAAELVRPTAGRPFTRIIVEKPIGHDLESARELNATIAYVFDESQVFRIDHYLGKETVQSLLVMRFANSIFEPLWNHKHVDHVQITVAEEEGVGTRANYYEEAGALRDMVQNHLTQVLTLIAMEVPQAIGSISVRQEKIKVLRSIAVRHRSWRMWFCTMSRSAPASS